MAKATNTKKQRQCKAPRNFADFVEIVALVEERDAASALLDQQQKLIARQLGLIDQRSSLLEKMSGPLLSKVLHKTSDRLHLLEDVVTSL